MSVCSRGRRICVDMSRVAFCGFRRTVWKSLGVEEGISKEFIEVVVCLCEWRKRDYRWYFFDSGLFIV